MDIDTNKEYLSSKDAGAILGYTHDYISRLCRQGRMSGIQKGREWYVTKEELEAFKQRHEVFLQEKKKELSKKFSQIRKEAEARKREARLQASKQEPQSDPVIVDQKTLKFSMPKQVVALLVLALVLFGQTILSSSVTNSVANTSAVSESNLYTEIQKTIDTGIQETIYTQAEVVEPVVVAIDQNIKLKNFFTPIIELPKETITSLREIGNAYLTLYVLQGQALYSTLGNLNSMGAVVLRGYELIGESFWWGSKDIIQRYTKIFNLEKQKEALLKYPRAYTAHVSGGYEHIKEDLNYSVLSSVSNLSLAVFSTTKNNIYLNLSSVQHTASDISQKVFSYVNNFFEFDLSKKEEKIRAIKLHE